MAIPWLEGKCIENYSQNLRDCHASVSYFTAMTFIVKCTLNCNSSYCQENEEIYRLMIDFFPYLCENRLVNSKDKEDDSYDPIQNS